MSFHDYKLYRNCSQNCVIDIFTFLITSLLYRQLYIEHYFSVEKIYRMNVKDLFHLFIFLNGDFYLSFILRIMISLELFVDHGKNNLEIKFYFRNI